MKTLDIKINGMDCMECTRHVETAIRSVPDVERVDVFLGTEKARITYSSTLPNLSQIENAVKEAGYEAVVGNMQSVDGESSKESKRVNKFLIVFGLLIGLVLFVTVIGEWFGVFKSVTDLIPWYLWLAVISAGGWPIFRNVLRTAMKGQIISHTLMTLGVLAAIAVGEWPTAAVVVLFMRTGDYVEGLTTGKARSAVRDLTALAPSTATVFRNGAEISVAVEDVSIGETVIVRPGEAIPVDGEVISGNASIDLAAISGESMPVDVKTGSRVFAASILLTGMLKVRVTAMGKDSTFGKIIQLVEDAEANRADVQRTADKFAGYYLPVVAGIALATYIIRDDPMAAAATLVVACSCSFALATPIAMLASIGSAARQGLLIKGGKHIETLEKIDTLFVDKTGTLTTGKPQVTDVVSLEKIPEDNLISLAAAVEQYSEHPLGKAVINYAREREIRIVEPSGFTSMPGIGVEAKVGKDLVSILNKPLSKRKQIEEETDRLADQGKSLFYIHINRKTVGIIAASDEPRLDVKSALDEIKELGVRQIILISGDREPAVRKLAADLEIEYHAELLPEDKIILIQNAQSRGEKVAMIGDGINDAPALAKADVGIAMGETGSEIAIEAAHVTLLREDWSLVPRLFKQAKRTMRIVRLNILFTAIYNLFGLSLAALGILPPVLAAALQSLPDVGIMANSARLIKTK